VRDGGGVDQIAKVLELLRTDPFSRRILFSAWNPQQLDQMALPPCHMMAQFYVSEECGERHLSCQMYQRSIDMACGLPWNMLSYALLTQILALKTGMRAKELIIVGGDAHVYNTHLDGVRTQTAPDRRPRPWPKMVINPRIAAAEVDFEDMSIDDFELVGYMPHAAIKFEMAI
jgi:thymidylate synthase